MAQNYQINTTVNPYQIVIANVPVGSQLSKAGTIRFNNGATTASVSFTTALPNPMNVTNIWTVYSLSGSVLNANDSFPEDLIHSISAFTVNGFTVRLNAPTDTANYYFCWNVVGVVNG